MSNVLTALQNIDPASLNYQEWINVGMALHAEGYDCSVWDDWSRKDSSRYHSGECQRKWRSFGNGSSQVKGGTIVQMAREQGWQPFADNGPLDWNDTIQEDGDAYIPQPKAWHPVEELITYIETLFKPQEYVGYVTGQVWEGRDGRWSPSKGIYNRTAGELLTELRKYPDDIGATVGDWKEEAGAWIRFNPVDGKGVRNENVTGYRFALVESDTIPVPEQEALYRKLELPIACLVHSGGKSLHAIVHIDAEDEVEYRNRVDKLYAYLEKNGVCIDKQNRNPSRLSRMPGVTRNGNRQHLVATNIGRGSWEAWLEYIDGLDDNLPGFVSLSEYKDKPPMLPEELIKGILRCGHKMLISGSSKAGKSFLLMELCIALAEGIPWLGFPCKKSRVLYVNLEIDPASCINRFLRIYDALKVPKKHMDDIVIWNLRGKALPLDKLVGKLVHRSKGQQFNAIIIDPIYKVITGDENNASDMAAFCNQFDKICADTGCATIYCHHHSKGAQGAKRAMDRASGSGVFARDPDAQLDMIQLDLSEDIVNYVQDGNSTGWRLESSLREFPNIRPVNFWFEYPIHRIDKNGTLDEANAEGSFEAVRAKNKKCTTAEDRKASIDNAYQACAYETPITVKAMAEYLGVSERCIRDRLKEYADVYWCKNGTVGRHEE